MWNLFWTNGEQWLWNSLVTKSSVPTLSAHSPGPSTPVPRSLVHLFSQLGGLYSRRPQACSKGSVGTLQQRQRPGEQVTGAPGGSLRRDSVT